jgi:hypothetical protein
LILHFTPLFSALLRSTPAWIATVYDINTPLSNKNNYTKIINTIERTTK